MSHTLLADGIADTESLEQYIKSAFSTACDAETRAVYSEALADEWWRRLHNRYTEPNRFYHDLTHIASMLTGLEAALSSRSLNAISYAEVDCKGTRFSKGCDFPNPVEHDIAFDAHTQSPFDKTGLIMAITFHDFIYHSDNPELDSVEAWNDCADDFKFSGDLRERVSQYIKVTIDHQPADEPNEQLMSDLDMEVLSWAWGGPESESKSLEQDDDGFRASIGTARRGTYWAYVEQNLQENGGDPQARRWLKGRADFLTRTLAYPSGEKKWIFAGQESRSKWEERARANMLRERAIWLATLRDQELAE